MTTRDARKTGRAAGQQAGKHVQRDVFRPSIAYHEHEDGEVCHSYHADTRCIRCEERWAMVNFTICSACFSRLTPTLRPDGSHIPLAESNAALQRVREEYAA
jgi:hypothetical protein